MFLVWGYCNQFPIARLFDGWSSLWWQLWTVLTFPGVYKHCLHQAHTLGKVSRTSTCSPILYTFETSAYLSSWPWSPTWDHPNQTYKLCITVNNPITYKASLLVVAVCRFGVLIMAHSHLRRAIVSLLDNYSSQPYL